MSNEVIHRANQVLIGNYARVPIEMRRGSGSRLWDQNNKEYLDLFAGFGGCVLGHCHPDLIRAVNEQSTRLWHVGNSFHSEPQVEFAERLKKHSFDGRAFFCHSGLEANEAAVKLARLRGMAEGGKKWKTISLNKSFHGRSLAMISATGNPAIKEGFGPLVPGFTNIEPLDFDALEKAVDDETCCIIMEPIQGEGGVNLFPIEYIARVRKLCDDRKLTLIFDEVWTGGGRTGEWFGHQWFKQGGSIIEPDIMTMGKAIGGGLPVGAMWAKPEVARLLVPGKHGCTLGANQICMKVAQTIFDVIERENLLNHVKKLGEIAMGRLKHEPKLAGKVKEVRGHGLFIGIEFEQEPKDLVARALEQGVVINVTYKKIVRLAPAVNISENDLQIGLDRFIHAVESIG